MAEKQFKIPVDKLKPVAEGHGGCFASDMITVHGNKVGYMYREDADFPEDSGWRFFSGKESEDYLEDASHTEVHDVNTIANYDPAIVPLLQSPVGSAFERRGWFSKLVAVPFAPSE